jgi:hypothetical protein
MTGLTSIFLSSCPLFYLNFSLPSLHIVSPHDIRHKGAHLPKEEERWLKDNALDCNAVVTDSNPAPP